jgi:hypothetical protein
LNEGVLRPQGAEFQCLDWQVDVEDGQSKVDEVENPDVIVEY